MRYAIAGIYFLALCSSCATTHPCAEGGDIGWSPPVTGDKQCRQIKRKDGGYVNQGQFTQWWPNGKIALEGMFQDGRKDGVWTQYNDRGEKVAERYFEDGVERMVPKK